MSSALEVFEALPDCYLHGGGTYVGCNRALLFARCPGLQPLFQEHESLYTHATAAVDYRPQMQQWCEAQAQARAARQREEEQYALDHPTMSTIASDSATTTATATTDTAAGTAAAVALPPVVVRPHPDHPQVPVLDFGSEMAPEVLAALQRYVCTDSVDTALWQNPELCETIQAVAEAPILHSRRVFSKRWLNDACGGR